jgi:hypothetical protein
VAVHTSAWKFFPAKSAPTRWRASFTPCAAFAQRADSAKPRRSAQVTIATTKRCRNTMRMPSSPIGASAIASHNTITGPRLQATWVNPSSFPRAFAGANSPTSASDVGTSAPTATPTTNVPRNSISWFLANAMHRMPSA